MIRPRNIEGNLAAAGFTEWVFNDAAADVDFRVEGDANENLFQIDAGLFSGVGSVGIGRAAVNTASFTIDPPAMTAVATVSYSKVRINNSSAVTVPTGTTALVSSLHIDEPNITATGTVTTACTVYIEAAPTEGTNNHSLIVDAGSVRFDGAIFQGGNAGDAATLHRLIVKKTGIADNTATSVITVTVPNSENAAAIRLFIVASLGTGTDTFESTRCAEGAVVVSRKTGDNVVPAAATLTLAQISTDSGGGTLTLAYGVSSVTGAAGATNTFDIQVTLVKTGTITDLQCVVYAELLNAQAAGVTMAAA